MTFLAWFGNVYWIVVLWYFHVDLSDNADSDQASGWSVYSIRETSKKLFGMYLKRGKIVFFSIELRILCTYIRACKLIRLSTVSRLQRCVLN